MSTVRCTAYQPTDLQRYWWGRTPNHEWTERLQASKITLTCIYIYIYGLSYHSNKIYTLNKSIDQIMSPAHIHMSMFYHSKVLPGWFSHAVVVNLFETHWTGHHRLALLTSPSGSTMTISKHMAGYSQNETPIVHGKLGPFNLQLEKPPPKTSLLNQDVHS